MRYPDAGATEIYVSADGTSWTKLDTTETIGTESGNVKPYTYDFAPVGATFVKFHLTNSTQATGTTAKACTGITEIELKVATGSRTTNTTAELQTLTVNGKKYRRQHWTAKYIQHLQFLQRLRQQQKITHL